jgi:hypothetical protein
MRWVFVVLERQVMPNRRVFLKYNDSGEGLVEQGNIRSMETHFESIHFS